MIAIPTIILLVNSFVSDKQSLSPVTIAMVPIIIITLGLSFHDPLIKGRFDISFGVYIYAFPIQQIMINYIHGHFLLTIAISVLLTTSFATLSWIVVEKRFLLKNNRLFIKHKIIS